MDDFMVAQLASLQARIEETLEPSRARSLALTRLDECEMWLQRCNPTTPSRSQSPDEAEVIHLPCSSV
jgi:hypothetical protein